ncbi:DUF4956 domain-containing protein [Brachybacterium sp. DNPG3]
MPVAALYALDIVAALVLTFGIYWPRHRRRDLVVAFLGINVGVLAVSALLVGSTVTAGLGLGLFGVLSIIRLRSDELAQHEIAYYFAMLALGLVGGLTTTPSWISVGFVVAIVATLAIVDHPGLLGTHRRQVIVADRAIADEDELRAYFADTLNAKVTALSIIRTDFVSDTTMADVRYQVLPARQRGAAVPAGLASAASRPAVGASAAPSAASASSAAPSASSTPSSAGAAAPSAPVAPSVASAASAAVSVSTLPASSAASATAVPAVTR